MLLQFWTRRLTFHRKKTSQFYDSAIISEFADDIERARLVWAVERDEPGAREKWEKSTLVRSSKIEELPEEDTPQETEDITENDHHVFQNPVTRKRRSRLINAERRDLPF
jgi:hypothetical protein